MNRRSLKYIKFLKAKIMSKIISDLSLSMIIIDQMSFFNLNKHKQIIKLHLKLTSVQKIVSYSWNLIFLETYFIDH
jgi:hypothetical protein